MATHIHLHKRTKDAAETCPHSRIVETLAGDYYCYHCGKRFDKKPEPQTKDAGPTGHKRFIVKDYSGRYWTGSGWSSSKSDAVELDQATASRLIQDGHNRTMVRVA
jgi:hypothetical protein